MRVLGFLLFLLLPACASSLVAGLPSSLDDVPGVDDRRDPALREARTLFERGSEIEALAAAELVLLEAPDHVDALRLRQDILRQRGRIGLLLAETEERLRRAPGDALAHYLRGRLVSGTARKLQAFRRAADLAPRSFWGWLGVAFVLRTLDPQRAITIYTRLYELSGGHPTVAVALAAALRSVRRDADALRIYERLRATPEWRGIGELGMAETLLAGDERARAWAPLVKALELRPFDPGVRQLVQLAVASGLPEDRLQQLLDVLRRDPERLRAFCGDGGAPILASLFARVGEPFAARSVLEAFAAGEAGTAAVRRLKRQLLLSTGDVRGFLEEVVRAHPAFLLEDESNQVRGLWVTLLRGPWSSSHDPIARVEDAAGLTEALLRVGLLEEADIVGTMALLRHKDADAAWRQRLSATRDEARREEVFERAVRHVVYQGYVDSGAARDLATTLADLRRISIDYLGSDVVGTPRTFWIPFVGSLVDPFAAGLGQHVARYNRHLVLGQRAGGTVEAMLLTRLSVRELDPGGPLPLAGACREVIGEDREIRPLSGVLGGDLAGVALLNHYIVDMDAVREWADGVRDRRAIAAADDFRLLRDPLPDDVDDLEPAGVDWRLAVVSPVQDSELDAAVLDMIRWHERAHLVDSFFYLPVESNLWRAIGLLMRNGFRPGAIEAELEGRAETAALALSPHTGLVLAHVAVFLAGEADSSPHAKGFRALAQRFLALARERGVATPEASRWHLIDAEQARKLGRELLQRMW